MRSLGRRSIPTVVASEHERPPAFASEYRDETVAVPDPAVDIDAYAAALLDLAEREDVGTVLPFREPDVYALARDRSAFAEHVGTPWPTLETLREVQDRIRLVEAAERAGVAVPATDTFDEWDRWDDRSIVKARYTFRAPEYADRFGTPETQWSATEYVEPGDRPDREATVGEMGHIPLVQEYVPTLEEYGFFALYDHGEPVPTFQHRQERGWKYAGSPSAFRRSVDIPALERAGRALLDELDWHGVAMVEFLRDPRDGEFKLMEVNPRFWSSLPFTVQAGVDFPLLYWAQGTDREIDGTPAYDVGVAGHLLWGELLHLYSIVAEENPLVETPSLAGRTADVLASLARHRRFDYLSADDPDPFLRDVCNALAGTVPDADQEPAGAVSRAATAVQRVVFGE